VGPASGGPLAGVVSAFRRTVWPGRRSAPPQADPCAA